jgi:hypothetical protein
VISSGVDGNDLPFRGDMESYSVTATDPDEDPLTYAWTLSYSGSGDPVDGYDGVSGDGVGGLDIDWDSVSGAQAYGSEFNLDCVVSDESLDTSADTLATTNVT